MDWGDELNERRSRYIHICIFADLVCIKSVAYRTFPHSIMDAGFSSGHALQASLYRKGFVGCLACRKASEIIAQ